MDQALKQRLIGATVLIALGVIFLPVFIGGPDDQTAVTGNDEFLIPPQPNVTTDGNSPGRRLPLVQPAPVNPNSEPADQAVDLTSGEIRLPRPDEALPQETPETIEQPGVADTDTDADADQSISTPDPQNQTAAVVPPAADPVSEIPPEPVQTDNQADNQPSSSQDAGTPAPVFSSPLELGQDWWVQVASLGNPDNVARLISQIESLGYPAASQSISSNGVVLHRVVAGPFASEAEAEAANAGIRNTDSRLNPQILGPAAEADEGSVQPQPQPVTETQLLDRYAVQVGVFSSAENSENLVSRLNNAGYAVYSERVDGNGQSLFRVRIGPLLSESDANSIAARIQRDLGVQGIVVDYQQ